MTREIKFRAWDGEHMDYALEEACVQESGINFIARYMQGYQGYVFMQFTGLKDKNGREIYEGDILLTDASRLPVKVGWSRAGFTLYGGMSGMTEIHLNCNTEIVLEVIGNIYENPELLAPCG